MIERARDHESGDGLSRRDLLVTATAAAGALAGMSIAPADAATAAGFGDPLVEVRVPAGILSLEQKAAMIRDITDVVRGVMKQPPDANRRMFVQIFETAESGFGVNGQVFTPRGK